MRVVLVQPVQSPYWTERLRALAQNEGLQITLLLERPGFSHHPCWEPVPIDGVKVEVLGSSVVSSVREGGDLGYRIKGVRSIPWRLSFALLRRRPDVVIVCNATQMMFALLARSLARFRLGLLVEDTPHATRNLGKVIRVLRALTYRKADRWFAFSEDARSFLGSIGVRDRVSRTSWSLDLSSFQVGRKCAEGSACYQRNSTPRKATVLFSGQLVERKGILQLIGSWAQLPLTIRKRAQLVVAGDGPLKREVEEFCRSRGLDEISLVGNISYADMKSRFSQADLFVLPTLHDLFSLALLEAMASGCPVVTTPFTGGRELVEEGRNGWIVDPTVSGELTRVLETALSGNIDLARMGRAARERIADMDNDLVMGRLADDLRTLARE